MAGIRRFWLKLQVLSRRNRNAQRLDDEIQFHLDHQIAENITAGMSGKEAKFAAMRDFGNSTVLKKEIRETWGWIWLEQLGQDLRHGARLLRKNPGFTAVALLTLTLGIGATASIFSVVNAVLLRPIPYREPQRLVSFFEDLDKLGYPRLWVSPPTYLDLKAQTHVFEDVAAVNESAFNLSDGMGGARQLTAALATYNLFAVLGREPMLGTAFLPEEDRPGANHVVLLSYALWQSEFAANAGIVGQTIRLNAEPYIVKGVMPPGFSFPDKEIDAIQIWVPRAFNSQELAARTARYLTAVGRLRPGISLDQANAEIRMVSSRDIQRYPNEMIGVSRFFAEPLEESYTHDTKNGLVMLMTAVGLILLIACANVANLLLSRAAGRRREIVLRAALGASTGRIVRQLLVESALLSAAGGALGTAVAVGSFGFLKHLIPEDLSHITSLTFDLPGVIGDAKLDRLNDSSRYEVYRPYLQSRDSWEWPRFLVIRTTGEPQQVVEELRRMIAGIDPQEPLNHVMTMTDIVDRETSQTEIEALLLGGLASLALIMACVGIYGVMAYLVAQRIQEIGVRVALGAQSRNILSLILGGATKLALTGVGIGVVAALLTTRLMRSFLFDVSPLDPLTFTSVGGLLMIVALLASYIPARRATRVDPMVALRYQ